MSDNRFIINKIVDNTYKFTIKSNGSIMPLVLTNTDTFSYKLIKLDDESIALTGPIAVTDMINGEVTLTISSIAASTLVSDKGEVVDGRYLKPTYRLLLICNTLGNGNFIAKVDKVYVQ